MQNRARNAFVLALVAGLILASLVAVVGIPGAVKSQPTRLGLDLKGGVELTYQARPTTVAKVTTESIERAIEVIRKRVDQLGVAQSEIQRSGPDEIVVGLPDVQSTAQAEREVGKTAQLYFYDWETNVIGPNGQPDPTNTAVTGGAEPGQSRTGLPYYRAVQRAAKRPAILPPTNSDIASYQKGCTAALNAATTGADAGCIYGSWYLLDSAHEKVLRGPEPTREDLYKGLKLPAGAKAAAVHVNPGTVIVQAQKQTGTGGKVINASPESWYVLNDNPVLTGSSITHPQASIGSGGAGGPSVNFGFTGHGKEVFERVTREIARRGERLALPGVPKQSTFQHFAIVLEDQLITVPYINYQQNPDGIDATTGSEISGNFTSTTANELANELQSGALPVKLNLISESQVSATLGTQALDQGLVAGIAGLAIVCAFLIIFYRILGLVAVGGLAIYGLYLFALIKLIPVTLTLPGIAGLILTIGVAADANIVIFERIKEEIRAGRSVAAGIVNGYRHGFAAIIDANVVTFMTAFILFALATAEVKGFAFMLGLGVLVSLFTAVLATQAALGSMGRLSIVAHPRVLGAGPKRRRWRFDFMGSSRWFFTLSGVILTIGALAIGARGLNFGIDFTSGTRIQTSFAHAVSQTRIRGLMGADGYPDAQIQKITGKTSGGAGYQISVKRLGPHRLQTIRGDLERKLGAQHLSVTSVGPTFGSTVANEAILGIIASLLVISVYIALRFEWKYAVPVLIALAHDLLITTGVYALTGREVTAGTVAALLTILGYSMYDTIIVFDRVRENVPRMARAAFSQIVNRSMSEVLTRSLATSFCTLLPVTALLVFGGTTLKDFAFALLVGIASGAYSSIFIASPVLTHWKEREGSYRNRRTRLIREYGFVPAYAGAGAAARGETEQERARRTRRGRLVVGEAPGEEISQAEFDDLVRDLDIEEPQRALASPSSARPSEPAAAAALAEPQPVVASERAASPPDGAAGSAEPGSEQGAERAPDATPEDLVLKDAPRARGKAGGAASRRRRHGRKR
jgi:SecD/SecF fusion protein